MADWQAGDMALCIRFRSIQGLALNLGLRRLGPSPEVGKFYTVETVGVGWTVLRQPRTCLTFKEIGPDFEGCVGYEATCFIKVTPPADMIEQERRESIPA